MYALVACLSHPKSVGWNHGRFLQQRCTKDGYQPALAWARGMIIILISAGLSNLPGLRDNAPTPRLKP